MVSYIYITAEPDRMLMGVVDLREMVLAADDTDAGRPDGRARWWPPSPTT